MSLASFEDFDAPPDPSRAVWIVAAIGAVLLHAAVILFAVKTFVPENADDDIGAPALEIDMDFTAPRAEPTDLPPGPEAEASAASPAQVQQQQKVVQSELPRDEPIERENADRVVSPEAVKHKPEEEKPEVSQQQTNASIESVASEATAMPTSEVAREAPKAAAPVIGIGATAQRIKATWEKRLVAHLARHKRFPAGEPARSVLVVVRFTIDRLGHVTQVDLAKGSGIAAFDREALAMVQRSNPVPAPPAVVADEQLSYTVPVQFRAPGK